MENKDSKDILPKEERVQALVWAKLLNESSDETSEIGKTILQYNKALESSEERVKQLEEEKEEIKGMLISAIKGYRELEKENIRLKELFKDCHEHGEKYGVFETIKRYAREEGINPDFLKFEDWCKKNNINL